MATVQTLPTHVAVVMDGNGRWASKRLLPRSIGHWQGEKACREVVEACLKQNIKYLTLFAFSSENWQRPREEVQAIMELFLSSLKNDAETLHEQGIQVRFIGGRTQFSAQLRELIDQTEALTKANDKMLLSIAVDYSGRWDVMQASKQLCKQVQLQGLNSDELDENAFEKHLSTYPLPDPDLFIRTGGEQRISNFLIWQLAYTELYFSDTLWPDFDAKELELAFASYAKRRRRYGLVPEQIES